MNSVNRNCKYFHIRYLELNALNLIILFLFSLISIYQYVIHQLKLEYSSKCCLQIGCNGA